MIALDTNVLVRLLIDDDRAQHLRAARLVERADREGSPLFVSELVFCELVWVLRYSYKVTRARISEILRQLLHSRQLQVASRDAVAAALDAFEGGRGDVLLKDDDFVEP